MGGSVFSVPIFIVVLRETIEAAIIVSVLLGLVENLVTKEHESRDVSFVDDKRVEDEETQADRDQRKKYLLRRMRIQIWAGTGVGLFCAIAIGAAFIAVFFTLANDIWASSEEIWEGTFSLVAAIIIFIMGLTMLRIDRSKIKWQHKLEGAFNKKVAASEDAKDRSEGNTGKWALFVLPLITVLREGLEAVVFVGGVSLGQTARSIPLAAIVGLICGLIIGYLIYASSSRLNLTIFLIVSTNILFLLGAGLFSKSVGDFERYKFNKGVGADVAELGSGPGSFDVRGNVWHLDYFRNEKGDTWIIFNAILGWSNNASYGTILSYVFYWLFAIVCLIYMKWQEGRMKFFGIESAAGQRSRLRRERREAEGSDNFKRSVSDKKEASIEGSTETPITV
ncbi:iron permease FTR1 [Meredithblackwellia eburnea MCA 4105]